MSAFFPEALLEGQLSPIALKFQPNETDKPNRRYIKNEPVIKIDPKAS